jgi:hypothetical protein
MKKLILLLSLSFIFISCQPPGGGPPVLPPTNVVTDVSHVGSWTTGCITASDDSTKIIHNLVISDNPKTVSLTVKIYDLNSSDCSSGQSAEFDSMAEYTRSGSSYTTTLKSYGYKPVSANMLPILNQNGFCGLSDWVAGVRKNIIGLNCVLPAIKNGNPVIGQDGNPETVSYSRGMDQNISFNVSMNGDILQTNEYPDYDYSKVE